MRKLTPGKLVIASHNEGKVREISALLGPYGMAPVSAGSLGLPEPEETGTTFAENAALKALASATASGLPALADDSGLDVAALGGRPGVYTADWAERRWFEGEPGRDWYMAMGKVEGLLCAQGPQVDRSAAFVCTLCLAWPDGETALFEGRVTGSLVWPPRGERGFGYDPVFLPGGATQTFGEMPIEAKQAVSHRARAFEKLVAALF
ncbi:MAG: RdgB/HAM1 family non-canonical purine NTP pyrophosphatase [Alphaproteobacteria bacterium]|nr:RdgB/HAM1 family non-canonical purine NTP pyrophosphatase [Alphaproteobacteria bacterium]MBU0795086.1 RdgB/HAM1 family non-canonical purine NTP pyrophosphatase [Alphaproteobacteria bacterium]MBU0874991.1 RdgB/HAM1 family non-canonical purine NTP pyrophosphatase [Alphaproteobacteria bacterium]MBU1769219.1 RdgB/HAM1 family non-canonical purine NTP pyrophosphatase [Alphaproteobacteria bacterium]